MRKLSRLGLTLGTLSLSLMLTACENFDPTAIFDAEIFNTKKRLPGERKPVFPEGTPGVPQGVPPELIKGHQPPAEPEATPKQANADSAEEKPKPKPKPKPKVAKPAETSAPTTGSAQPAPSATQQAQRPEQPAQAQRPATASGWPSSAQPSGGAAWPDPPAAR
jgi:outer membrane biosynthesis protein TonB